MTEKPNLAAFAARATKKAVPSAARPADREPVKHLQVRVTRDDAVRFRRVAEDKGQSVQSALIDAMNLYLRNAGAHPIIDIGTSSRGVESQ
ncbi:MAG: hypothetical protein IPP28_00980 [Xanthomonadales bacterium]|nr:hypothetical protein [Xanthomonadales bacterium]